jgi:two-component system chemotaxis response regulator CheY
VNALVVDDSRTMRVVLRRILEERGFNVREAGDGSEALAAVDADAPDLVLLDWNMPGMTGLEVVQALAGHPARPGMRIVMVTTETEMDRIGEALGAGADEYLMKPFTGEAVAEKLLVLGVGS